MDRSDSDLKNIYVSFPVNIAMNKIIVIFLLGKWCQGVFLEHES